MEKIPKVPGVRKAKKVRPVVLGALEADSWGMKTSHAASFGGGLAMLGSPVQSAVDPSEHWTNVFSRPRRM